MAYSPNTCARPYLLRVIREFPATYGVTSGPHKVTKVTHSHTSSRAWQNEASSRSHTIVTLTVVAEGTP